jgi:anti-sigma B factor antagonist
MRLNAVPSHVRLSSHRLPTHTVVAMYGRLDGTTTTAASLRERLFSALNSTAFPLIIDLSGVESCDAAGLATLVGARRRGRLHGITVSLAAPRPSVRLLLQATGLHRAFAVHPTIAAAELRLGAAEPRRGPSRGDQPARQLAQASPW